MDLCHWASTRVHWRCLIGSSLRYRPPSSDSLCSGGGASLCCLPQLQSRSIKRVHPAGIDGSSVAKAAGGGDFVRVFFRWGQFRGGTPTIGHRLWTNGIRRNQHSPGTPTTGLRERENDTSRSTGRSGRQKAVTRRNMRREERVTVQGPVKKQQPDGMSHRGRLCRRWNSRSPRLPHAHLNAQAHASFRGRQICKSHGH